MATLLDSYADYNTTFALANGYHIYAVQSFQCPGNYKITSAKFYLQRITAVTGTCYAVLMSHSGTYGTSSIGVTPVLATSDGKDVTTIAGSPTLYELTFSGANQYSMTSGTYYMIGMYFEGGDGSLYIQVMVDNSSPTHGGNWARYWEGASPGWIAEAGVDSAFYIYGDPSASMKDIIQDDGILAAPR